MKKFLKLMTLQSLRVTFWSGIKKIKILDFLDIEVFVASLENVLNDKKWFLTIPNDMEIKKVK